MELNNIRNSVVLEQLGHEYEQLGIADDFLFGKVMMNKSLCVQLLEILTGNVIDDVEDITVQKAVKITNESKGVRYDVYVEDNQRRIYDAEMQNNASCDLPKRCRFYQEMIDLNKLEMGDNYSDLKDSYVIFICTFDPFDKNLCCYSFANLCIEDYDLLLDDGRKILFFNTKGNRDNVSSEIAEFLDYIETGIVYGEFTVRLDDEVRKARMNREWKVEYMKEMFRYMDAKREAHEKGFKTGLEEGCEQGRISILHSLVNDGTLSIEIAADKAGMSVEEFLDKVKEYI